MPKINIDSLINKKINKLTIRYEIEPRVRLYKNRKIIVRMVHCDCDCGNSGDFILSNITRGHTKSCGCLIDIKRAETITQYNSKAEYKNKIGRSRTARSGYYGIYKACNRDNYYRAVVYKNGNKVEIGYGSDISILNNMRLEYCRSHDIKYMIV